MPSLCIECFFWYNVYIVNCVWNCLWKAGGSLAWMFVNKPSIPMMLLWWPQRARATHLCYFLSVFHTDVFVLIRQTAWWSLDDPRVPPFQPFITHNGKNQTFSVWSDIERTQTMRLFHRDVTSDISCGVWGTAQPKSESHLWFQKENFIDFHWHAWFRPPINHHNNQPEGTNKPPIMPSMPCQTPGAMSATRYHQKTWK